MSTSLMFVEASNSAGLGGGVPAGRTSRLGRTAVCVIDCCKVVLPVSTLLSPRRGPFTRKLRAQRNHPQWSQARDYLRLFGGADRVVEALQQERKSDSRCQSQDHGEAQVARDVGLDRRVRHAGAVHDAEII